MQTNSPDRGFGDLTQEVRSAEPVRVAEPETRTFLADAPSGSPIVRGGPASWSTNYDMLAMARACGQPAQAASAEGLAHVGP